MLCYTMQLVDFFCIFHFSSEVFEQILPRVTNIGLLAFLYRCKTVKGTAYFINNSCISDPTFCPTTLNCLLMKMLSIQTVSRYYTSSTRESILILDSLLLISATNDFCRCWLKVQFSYYSRAQFERIALNENFPHIVSAEYCWTVSILTVFCGLLNLLPPWL